MSQDSKSRPGENRRQHQRVAFERDWGEVQALIGAKAIWPNQDRVDVFDMSYAGAAIAVTERVEHSVGDRIDLTFELPRQKNCQVKAEIMWMKEDVAGLRLVQLSPEVRLAFNEFLEDQLIGANLDPVAKEFFDANLDCDYWYQGPHDTHVWLWFKSDGQSLEKAMIELGGEVLTFEKGQFQKGGQVASDSLEGYGDEETSAGEAPQALAKEAPFVQRVMAVLSQIKEPKGPLRQLLNEMVKIPS